MIEITLKLEKADATPLYIQIYTYIREEIKAGRIDKGTKLPSIRYLSEHLGVSKITVDNAYQQLLVEGYIESRTRSGMYVLSMDETIPNTSARTIASASSTASKSTSLDTSVLGQPIQYDFKYGDIDIKSFNMTLWRKLTAEALNTSDGELLQYGDRQGEIGLRREISKYLRASRGVLCSEDQIVITSGTQSALHLLCDLTEAADKTIAFENPGWQRARMIFEQNQFRTVSIPLDASGLSVTALKKQTSKFVYITPSHQFPTGIVMPITRRQKLLRWAIESDSYIIEDDYDSEFRYNGIPIPALHGLDTSDRVIYLGSFSKLLAPSIRISYMVLPKAILENYQSNLYKFEQTTARLNQEILKLFIANDYFERHIRKMRIVYNKKHAALISAIKTYLGRSFKVIGGNAGLHILLEVSTPLSEAEVIARASDLGVRVYPASHHWVNVPFHQSPVILLGFGGLSPEEITEGIKRLGLIEI